jgi:AraC family transcriptional regulator
MPQNALSSAESENTKRRAVAVTGQPSPVSPRTPRIRRDVTVSAGHQVATRRGERCFPQVTIILPFGTAECELSWLGDSGRKEEKRVGERHVCVVGSDCPYSLAWRHAGSVATVRVGQAFLREFPADGVHRTAVYDLRVLAKGDLVMLETASTLQRIAGDPGTHTAVYVESLGTVLATHILRAHCGGAGRTGRKGMLSPMQLKRVTDHIEAHLERTFAVGDLAQKAGLSFYHFIRTFKNTTGMPPHQYVLRCRVERANDLLRTGNYRVSEVAHAVGFCDQSHLDRQFRKHFGVMPKSLLRFHSAQF